MKNYFLHKDTHKTHPYNKDRVFGYKNIYESDFANISCVAIVIYFQVSFIVSVAFLLSAKTKIELLLLYLIICLNAYLLKLLFGICDQN